MKKILFLLTITAAFILSSCDKESEGVSKVTTYATMEITGASTLFWQLGDSFVDPGCVALEGTTDISNKIVVESDVDATVGGFYTITYKVANSDGFWASTTRQVVVADLTDPLNGYYKSSLKRTVISSGASANRGPFTVMVFAVGGGKYYIDDLIGGWYNYGSGYGPGYAGPGIVQKNGDNTLSLVSASNWTWGPCSLTSTVSTVDPTTKTWILNTTGAGLAAYAWKVTLTNPSSF
jgi:hypothetical protein